MPGIAFILLAAVFLAYINGANDSFKGVATLWGSGASSYKKALGWATLTTFLGSLFAIFISAKLVAVFSGKGLVPQQIACNPHFLVSVGMGAALTVFVATLNGTPISTTHSLTGALIGAGLVAAGSRINFNALGSQFFMPLLIGPCISAFLALIIYPCFRFARINLGIERRMCLCIGEKAEAVSIQPDGTAVLRASGIDVTVDQLQNCRQYYQGKILGFDSQNMLDNLHFISSGAVSFARGLNDTPKIAAFLLVMSVFSLRWGILIAALSMALGGLINAKRVALTMSKKITKMNHAQGFSANLITAMLVIFASRWGLPVSTTHVSCGSLFGIGLVNKKADLSVIRQIMLSWVLTLPLSAAFSGACYLAINYIR